MHRLSATKISALLASDLLVTALLVPALLIAAPGSAQQAAPAQPRPDAQHPLKILPREGPPQGAEVPDFTWTTVKGETLSRESLAGKVVLLDFWASWCIPCRKAVPHLKSMLQAQPSDLFQIVGINVDDAQAKLGGWVATYGLVWPQVWDPQMKWARIFRVRSIPTYVLLDHRGRVAYATSGFSATSGQLLDFHANNAIQAARQARVAAAGGR